MTVSTTDNRVVQIPNGVQTRFYYTFLAYTADTIKAYFGTTLQVSGYTVTLDPDFVGGYVDFAVAPPAVVGTVTLARIEDLDQETDLVPYDKFPSKVIEQSFDKLTMICQQLSDTIGRSLTAPINDPVGTTLVVPPFAVRKGKILAFDPTTGDAVVSTYTLSELENAQATAAGAAATATTQAGISTTQAGIATTQAGISTTQAGISTTQAGIATAKAAEAAVSAANSLFLFSVQWWSGNRANIPGGYAPADGQLVSRATYPDATAGVVAGVVPVATDANWLSFPTNRGRYSLGDGSTNIRLPDYNGKSAGAYGAPFLRGDGAGSAASIGLIRQDQFQGHFHDVQDNSNFNSGAGSVAGGGAIGAIVNLNTLGPITDGVNGTPRTGSETRPIDVCGCFIVKLFGAVINQGSLDAATLAGNLAALTVRVTDAENKLNGAETGYITVTASTLAVTSFPALPVKPNTFSAMIKCTTANNGFSVGDEVPIHNLFDYTGSGNYGIQIQEITTTGLKFWVGVGLVASMAHKTTGVAFSALPSQWQINVRAKVRG